MQKPTATESPIRAALYSRISERDEKIDKVDIQERRLRAAAEEAGYVIASVHVDDGISAYKGKVRPGFLSLLAEIKAGRCDIVMAVAPDRFARRLEENEALQVLCISAGVKWHTLTGGVMDPSTPMAKAMASIAGVMAELESANKVERLRARFSDRLASGQDLWGNRPFGFEVDRMTVREVEADMVREGYRLILAGQSLYAIMRLYNASGVLSVAGKPWSVQTVKQVLLRPRNAGLLESKGVVLGDSLTPIVGREEWEQLTAILTDPKRDRKPGPKVLTHFMTGVAECAVCGSHMVSATASSRGRKLPIYKCSRSRDAGERDGTRHPTIQRPILEAAIPDAVMGALINSFWDESGESADPDAAGIGVLLAQRAELDRQKRVLQELALMPGADLGHTRLELARLDSDVTSIDERLVALRSASVHKEFVGNVRDLVAQMKAIASQERPMTLDELDTNMAYRQVFMDKWPLLTVTEKRDLTRSVLRVIVHPKGASTPARVIPHPNGKPGHVDIIAATGQPRIEFKRVTNPKEGTA